MIKGAGTRSLQVKLSGLLVLTSGLALLLAGSGFLGYELIEYRKATSRELSAMAEILGASSAAAITFRDSDAAAEALNALHGDKRIERAAFYDRNDRLFAQYPRLPHARTAIPALPKQAGVYFENGSVLLFYPIVLDRERIGTIFLQGSMNEVYARLWRYVGITSLVLLVSLGFAFLVSARLQSTITRPIAELVRVARHVTAERDYSCRARKNADDEIGLLIDSFNDMLSQIETYDDARKTAEESLRESEERYAVAVRGAKDGLWDWKLNSNEIYYSPRWKNMLGYDEDDIGAVPNEWLSRIHPADRARVEAEIATHQAGGTAEFTSEHRVRHRNGKYIWMLSRGLAVRNAGGVAVRMAGSQTDITEGKLSDPLTGLSNRLYFLDKLEVALAAARDVPNQRLAVLFLDLDRFKLVNDSLGHSAGDHFLVGIAARLQSSVRTTDLVARISEAATVARLGGDEFAILVPRVRRESDAIAVAERVLAELRAPLQIEGRQILASFSIGIALNTPDDTPEDLLRNADTAMYHAKSGGRRRYSIFDSLMRDGAIERMQIESDFRKAIETDQFQLQYQPKVRLDDGTITGFEALVRWNHPLRGRLSPGQFISIAEETDLIVPLGLRVLRQACQEAARWNRNGERHIPVSVNVSFKQLTNSNLAAEIRAILLETQLDPHCLKLEMTETSLMQNASEVVPILRTLKALGIGLEIDDFGTGYSSLNYLRQLPFDTLKIDRSFIIEIGAAAGTDEIVGTIIKLAGGLHLNVVAEGIETERQLITLQHLGCSEGQGFYFSQPVDPQQVDRWLQQSDAFAFSHEAALSVA